MPAILLPANDVDTLMTIAADPSRSVLTIDLPAQTITASDAQIGFPFDPIHKDMLVRGLSAVDSTLEHAATIESFERAYYADQPWLA